MSYAEIKDTQEIEIENCSECKELSQNHSLDKFIQENGECIVDVETHGHDYDRYFTEGEKKYEVICSKCKASWLWNKSWITDNGGDTDFFGDLFCTARNASAATANNDLI